MYDDDAYNSWEKKVLQIASVKYGFEEESYELGKGIYAPTGFPTPAKHLRLIWESATMSINPSVDQSSHIVLTADFRSSPRPTIQHPLTTSFREPYVPPAKNLYAPRIRPISYRDISLLGP